MELAREGVGGDAVSNTSAANKSHVAGFDLESTGQMLLHSREQRLVSGEAEWHPVYDEFANDLWEIVPGTACEPLLECVGVQEPRPRNRVMGLWHSHSRPDALAPVTLGEPPIAHGI